MKRCLWIATMLILTANLLLAIEDKKTDPNQLFYSANRYYQDGDYDKALGEYSRIFDAGLANGNLYYNVANSFFKAGETGLAVLNYERARRLIPRDGDLKSNLAYARSMAGGLNIGSENRTLFFRIFHTPLISFNINAIAISCGVFYLLVALFLTFFIVAPYHARRIFPIFLLVTALFIYNLGAFGMRYYDEVVLKHGIVVVREADCKYEPIEKSTTYYKLNEGDEVIVMMTRNGWSKVRRGDAKKGWVKAEAVEEI